MTDRDTAEPPRPDGQERAIDARVEGLAGQLVDAINQAPVSLRRDLRVYALEVIREGTETVDTDAARRPRSAPRGGNPIGMALLLGVFAAPMLLIFPPVGLTLAAVAIVLGLVGVGSTMLRR